MSQRVSLVVGIDDPENITLITGMQPSRIVTPKFGQQPLWVLASGASEDELDTSKHIDSLFEAMAPAWHQFVEISKSHEIVVRCYIWTEDDEATPVFTLRPDLLARMVDLNARFDVDL